MQLDFQRTFIKNLKLSSPSSAWKMALECFLFSSEPIKAKNDIFALNTCYPMKMRFTTIKKHSGDTEYQIDKKNGKAYLSKALDKPCLICHTQQRNVSWEYDISQLSKSMTTNLMLQNTNTKYQWLFFSYTIILLVWIGYFFLKLRYRAAGKLDVVSFVFVQNTSEIDRKTLPDIGLLKKKLLYLETGSYYIRGYMTKNIFIEWADKVFMPDNKSVLKHLSALKGVIIKNSFHYTLEGLRIGHIMTKAIKTTESLSDSSVLSVINNPSVSVGYKKLIWKLNEKIQKKHHFLKVMIPSD